MRGAGGGAGAGGGEGAESCEYKSGMMVDMRMYL
jgi:hypothetical protein